MTQETIQGQYSLMHPDGSMAYIDIAFDGVKVITNTKVIQPTTPSEPTLPDNPCGETTVLWPDDESIDAECIKEKGHKGIHGDGYSEWED